MDLCTTSFSPPYQVHPSDTQSLPWFSCTYPQSSVRSSLWRKKNGRQMVFEPAKWRPRTSLKIAFIIIPSFFFFFFPLPFFFFGGILKRRSEICGNYFTEYFTVNIWLLGCHVCFRTISVQRFFYKSCACDCLSSAISKMASLRVLVGCKRVIDYAVKVCKIYLKLQ